MAMSYSGIYDYTRLLVDILRVHELKSNTYEHQWNRLYTREQAVFVSDSISTLKMYLTIHID